MYVMTAYKAAPAATDAAGTLGIKNDTAKKRFYAVYKGADTMLRGDIIEASKVLSYSATPAASIDMKFKKVFVSLNPDVNGGNPVPTQDYILNIDIKQAFGKADTHNYIKFGAVRATTGMTAAQFWDKMKESLEANFKSELTKWFTFTVIAADSSSNTPAGLEIAEVEQPWRRGYMPKENVYFNVVNDLVLLNGIESNAFAIGKPTEFTMTGYKNGHIICDQEFFYMGERGDQYRMGGHPANIDVQYLAVPTESYCAVNIHYYSDDSLEGVQKSEKDLYIVGVKAEINKLITALNTATGKTVASLT